MLDTYRAVHPGPYPKGGGWAGHFRAYLSDVSPLYRYAPPLGGLDAAARLVNQYFDYQGIAWGPGHDRRPDWPDEPLYFKYQDHTYQRYETDDFPENMIPTLRYCFTGEMRNIKRPTDNELYNDFDDPSLVTLCGSYVMPRSRLNYALGVVIALRDPEFIDAGVGSLGDFAPAIWADILNSTSRKTLSTSAALKSLVFGFRLYSMWQEGIESPLYVTPDYEDFLELCEEAAPQIQDSPSFSSNAMNLRPVSLPFNDADEVPGDVIRTEDSHRRTFLRRADHPYDIPGNLQGKSLEDELDTTIYRFGGENS